MKNIAIIFFLAFSAVASATDYYISPSGSDNNPGAINSPFFTLNKAWSVAKAGDVIYARGGVYKYDSRQELTNKSGTSSANITVQAYPGENPVFTKSSSFTTPSWPVCLILVSSSNYVHIKGIEVSGFTQETSTIWYGIAVRGSNNNTFELINSHNNGHGMVIRDESNHNLVLNCDFHNNYDPLTSGDAYGNADGLEVGYQSSSMENTIRGCRIWNNSDDGIDLWDNNGNVIIDGCWSWGNGFREDRRTQGGDGGGFKFGATTTETGSQFKRTVTNCLSVYNRTKGFNQNGAEVKFYLYNNIAYKNPKGMVFYDGDYANVFKNNVVFDNGTNWEGGFSNSTKDHNSYDSSLPSSGPIATAADFVSVDTTGISGKRKSDGSKPDIDFLRLASGSALIDAGVDVGMTFSGNAPDLGPFESKSTASTVPAENLAYVASSVKSDNPLQVEVAYNLTLAGIAPSVSSFDIKVNNVSRPVSKVTITDKNVYLTLDSAVKSGDVINLSYIKPEVNPLQTIAGTIAETITAKLVTNTVAAVPTATVVNDGKISITPNPAKDFVEIANLNPGDQIPVLKIFDFAGHLIQEIKLENIANSRTVPISLKSGIYISQLFIGSVAQYVQKLIVVK